jgi:hypothetical protein
MKFEIPGGFTRRLLYTLPRGDKLSNQLSISGSSSFSRASFSSSSSSEDTSVELCPSIRGLTYTVYGSLISIHGIMLISGFLSNRQVCYLSLD